MPDRGDDIAQFLRKAGWAGANRKALAGDASSRQYSRLTEAGGKSAILMDDPANSTVRFAQVARHLRDLGFSAPDVLAMDASSGLMLLEDLGDAVVAELCKSDPGRERSIYQAAVDMLADLHAQPAPDWAPAFDATVMADQATLALSAYAQEASNTAHATLTQVLKAALQPLDAKPRVLLLRDFHAENLIWLPARQGSARIGLLDFQDAVAGAGAYDLASLIADARRDVAPDLAHHLIDHYADRTGQDTGDLARDVAILRVQRSLRILGVFARLCARDGKAQYVDLIPRVWAHLEAGLRDYGETGLSDTISALLPTPTPQFLSQLRSSCGTVPAL